MSVRWPTKEQGREVLCPECGAKPGHQCEGTRGQARRSNHRARFERWIAARENGRLPAFQQAGIAGTMGSAREEAR